MSRSSFVKDQILLFHHSQSINSPNDKSCSLHFHFCKILVRSTPAIFGLSSSATTVITPFNLKEQEQGDLEILYMTNKMLQEQMADMQRQLEALTVKKGKRAAKLRNR